jgi:membrane dipeptidase
MDAATLHRDAIVIDACAPILRSADHAPLWHAGGATCALATVALHDDDTLSTLRQIGRLRHALRDHPLAFLTDSVAAIRRAKTDGKLAVVLMFQSTAALGGEVHMVETFARLGVRSMNLAYNQAELAADGCMEPRGGGLSTFGRQVIAEMNRLGVLLDLSHTSHRATMEAMELSTAPVAFTHSNANAIYSHPRNLDDDQIRACVATGGVIGLNGHPAFVAEGTAAPTLDQLLAHLDYLVERAGIAHVGLGLDFSQAPGQQMSPERYRTMMAEGVWRPETLPPPPWTYPVADARHIGRLTEALLRRNWPEADIRAVLGGNFLRLFERVWGA